MSEKYTDSLRSFGHEIHVRDNFRCRYCGLDGRPFLNWFQLTIDHILPIRQGGKDVPENMVTSCMACESILVNLEVPESLSRSEIIKFKRGYVKDRMTDFFQFWKSRVAPLYIQNWQTLAALGSQDEMEIDIEEDEEQDV